MDARRLAGKYLPGVGGKLAACWAWGPWFAFADAVVWPAVPCMGTMRVTRGAVTQGADAVRAMAGGFVADAWCR